MPSALNTATHNSVPSHGMFGMVPLQPREELAVGTDDRIRIEIRAFDEHVRHAGDIATIVVLRRRCSRTPISRDRGASITR